MFTTFRLENALNMDGKYAIRVYQQAKSNIYKGEYIIKIDEFKKQLKLTQKSYKEYSNIKVGRKVEDLKFITSNKNNKQKSNI